MMKRRTTHEDAPAETEIRITWRQWQDGRWEAWVTDGATHPPQRVRSQAELERFLGQVYRCAPGSFHAELESPND